MPSNEQALSDGVRQAIRDSSKPTYEIGKLSGVSAQNLYRFLDESGSRGLSQGSIDKLGLLLNLSVTLDYNPLRPSHLEPYRRAVGLRATDLDKKINDPSDSPLSHFILRTVELHRWDVSVFAEHLGFRASTQMYRFLDGARGLSQEKLDALCSKLGLLVEGPLELRRSRPGAMLMSERRIYHPRPAARPAPNVAEDNQQGPPSLYLPPENSIDGES